MIQLEIMKQTLKKRHVPLVIGNWKMNPNTVGEAKRLFIEIRQHVKRKPLKTYVAIAAPAPYLSELQRLSPAQRLKLVAQDTFYEKSGAHTGEVSLSMLKSVGVEGVIIGHSERRAKADTLEEVKKNLAATLAAKVTAILCIGETTRDAHGNYFTVVEEQLRSALKDVTKNQLKGLIIAYEPVWAIGTGVHALPTDVYEMKLFITKVLSDLFGRSAAATVRIIYGGSVNAKNADELMSIGEVDGFLPGGASLLPSEFISIIKTVEEYA
jgi:triosephosphate isomerase